MHRSTAAKASRASARAANSALEGHRPPKRRRKVNNPKTPAKKARTDASNVQDLPSGLHSTPTTSSSATPSTLKKSKKSKVYLFHISDAMY